MNIDSKAYQQFSDIQTVHASEILTRVEKRDSRWMAGSDMKTFYVGSALGKTMQHVAARYVEVRSVQGVDKNAAMVARALRGNKLRYGVADIGDKCAIKEEWRDSFDVCLSFWTLHWLDDQLAALQNIHRVLRDGGQCLLAFCGRPVRHVAAVFEAVIQSGEWSVPSVSKLASSSRMPWSSDLQEDANLTQTYRAWMEMVGFTDVTVTMETLSYTYDSFYQLLGHVTALSLAELLKEVDDKQRVAVLALATSELRKQVDIAPDGRVTTTFEALVARGQKAANKKNNGRRRAVSFSDNFDDLLTLEQHVASCNIHTCV